MRAWRPSIDMDEFNPPIAGRPRQPGRGATGKSEATLGSSGPQKKHTSIPPHQIIEQSQPTVDDPGIERRAHWAPRSHPGMSRQALTTRFNGRQSAMVRDAGWHWWSGSHRRLYSLLRAEKARMPTGLCGSRGERRPRPGSSRKKHAP